MKRRKIKYHFNVLAALTMVCASLSAQPYIKEINAFKQQDSAAFPAAKQVLFAGSSSFRLWKDVQAYFPKHKILNRAFGGSTLPDMIRYQKDIIYPYRPRQIVIYCGENDFAASDTVTVDMVVSRFVQLFTQIRQHLHKVPIAYVSMKPSPSRRKLLPRYIEANEAIRKYLAQHKRTAFINVYDAMLNAEGQPIPQLFTKDSLHMNASGYAVWQKIIEPYLKK
jgi:lysophospholipase L1-like esterase